MGVKLTASTIFDQTELVANSLQPVYNLLRVFAANAEHYYLDDTSNRIFDKVPIEKPQRNGTKTRERNGIDSSGTVASLKGGSNIVLYQTNIGHAGEFINEIFVSVARALNHPY
jgi:hypothetical protein